MPGAPKRKPRLSDRVADEIIEYISRNKLQQGDKLPNESQLMEITGAGRSSVREAMKLLASRNIVTIKQGSGTYVAQMPGIASDPLGLTFVEDKVQLALDMLEIRQILEPEIAAMAAIRADEQDVANIMSLCERFDQLQRAGECADEVDMAIHEAIALASKNIVVPRLISTITTSVLLSIELTQRVRVAQSADEHRIIAEAIADHDPMTARETMYTHIYASRKQLKLVQTHGSTAKDEHQTPENPFMRSLKPGMQGVVHDLFGTRASAHR